MTRKEDILSRWNKHFNEVMRRKNKREKRLDKVEDASKTAKPISKEEVWAAIQKLKNGKAVAPDDIPVEV